MIQVSKGIVMPIVPHFVFFLYCKFSIAEINLNLACEEAIILALKASVQFSSQSADERTVKSVFRLTPIDGRTESNDEISFKKLLSSGSRNFGEGAPFYRLGGDMAPLPPPGSATAVSANVR